MALSLLPLYAAGLIVAAGTVTALTRSHRERLAVDVTRPLPSRPPAGGREYRRHRR